MPQEALRVALAAQHAEHERSLNVALAERDAEALEALRLLDAQHRGATNSLNEIVAAVNTPDDATRKPVADETQATRRKRRDRPRSRRTSAAIRAATAARDSALREAKAESVRLEEVMSSPGGSETSSPSQPSTDRSPLAADGDGGVGSEYGESYRANGGSPKSAPNVRFVTYTPLETPREAAPAWTVGNGPGATNDAVVVANVSSTPLHSRASNGAPGERAEVGDEDWPAELRVGAHTGGGSTAGGAVAGGTESATGTGLTVTEQRYRRELEALRSRVRELEGMMESRREERERVYRRKLRAAVAECGSLRVRHGEAGAGPCFCRVVGFPLPLR